MTDRMVTPVYTAGYEAMYAKLKVLEVFNAQPFVNPPRGLAANPVWFDKPAYLTQIDNNPRPPATLVYNPPPEYAYTVNLSQAQVDYINLSYDALIESTYQALATQTRLAAYMDRVELTFDAIEVGVRETCAARRSAPAASTPCSCGGAAKSLRSGCDRRGERVRRIANGEKRFCYIAERRSGSRSTRVEGLKVLVGAGSGVQL